MATYLQSNPGIYKIISITNGKIYVGCASNVRTRINGHLYDLRRKKIQNTITGEIYSSLRIASEILKIPKYELSRKLLGKRKNNTNLIYV